MCIGWDGEFFIFYGWGWLKGFWGEEVSDWREIMFVYYCIGIEKENDIKC